MVFIDGQCSFLFQPLMELNRDLKCLIERAWALHGKLNCEIEQSIKFCRFCSEHGRFCDVADQTPFEKRERLIVIRDSLKQVENILLLLQVRIFSVFLCYDIGKCHKSNIIIVQEMMKWAISKTYINIPIRLI